ncbi:hypothetical protein GCM10027404_32830 [Arthrobacter tumbae]
MDLSDHSTNAEEGISAEGQMVQCEISGNVFDHVSIVGVPPQRFWRNYSSTAK